MGYRSDVIIVLRNDVIIPEEVQKAFFEDCEFKLIGSCEGHRLFIRNHINWYADSAGENDVYHHVWIVDQFLQSLNDEQYRFFRIGEDSDDIEYKGWFYKEPFNVGIRREFTYEQLDDR